MTVLATQTGLFGELPGDSWLTLDEAAKVFRRHGAPEALLQKRALEDGVIRVRLNGHGMEFEPLDVDRWARLEGEISRGRALQQGA